MPRSGWTLDSRMTGIDVERFLAAYSGRDAHLDGTASAAASLHAGIRDPLPRGLEGRMQVNVADGVIREFPLLAAINRALRLAEGHLVDSNLLNSIFDRIIERGGAFDVQHFELGRTNEDFSRLTLKVGAPSVAGLAKLVEELIPYGCHVVGEREAVVRTADRDGCAPDDFYSTTNQRTHVRIGGEWIEARHQRMDAVIVLEDGLPTCRKIREVSAGDQVVCGLEGIRVVPEFRDRARSDFAFMSNEVSSERRVEASVGRIAKVMRETKARGGKVAVVACSVKGGCTSASGSRFKRP